MHTCHFIRSLADKFMFFSNKKLPACPCVVRICLKKIETTTNIQWYGHWIVGNIPIYTSFVHLFICNQKSYQLHWLLKVQ